MVFLRGSKTKTRANMFLSEFLPAYPLKHHSLTTEYMLGNTQKEDRRGHEGH